MLYRMYGQNLIQDFVRERQNGGRKSHYEVTRKPSPPDFRKLKVKIQDSIKNFEKRNQDSLENLGNRIQDIGNLEG